MDFLYYILVGGLLLLASPFLILRALISSSFRNEIKGRMKGANSLPELKDTLWIHASSVGEVRLAKVLIAGLIKEGESRPIALSTFTPPVMPWLWKKSFPTYLDCRWTSRSG